MKKIKLFFIAIFLLYLFSAQNAFCQNQTRTQNTNESDKKMIIEINKKEFVINLEDSKEANDFYNAFAKNQKSVKVTKFGGFEFYLNTKINQQKNDDIIFYEKNCVYYNDTYNAISFVYQNHNLGIKQAIKIGNIENVSKETNGDLTFADFVKDLQTGIEINFRKF